MNLIHLFSIGTSINHRLCLVSTVQLPFAIYTHSEVPFSRDRPGGGGEVLTAGDFETIVIFLS